LPQAPQFLTSVRTSRHTSPQGFCPVSHVAGAHAPVLVLRFVPVGHVFRQSLPLLKVPAGHWARQLPGSPLLVDGICCVLPVGGQLATHVLPSINFSEWQASTQREPSRNLSEPQEPVHWFPVWNDPFGHSETHLPGADSADGTTRLLPVGGQLVTQELPSTNLSAAQELAHWFPVWNDPCGHSEAH
jgi:hypothetical protein